MKLVLILAMTIGSQIAYAIDSDNLVSPSTINCTTEDLANWVDIEVDYYRTTGFAGPGTIQSKKMSASGGWSKSLAPENTRLAGMTIFSFNSSGSVVHLLLNPIFKTGTGDAEIDGKYYSLDCNYN